MLSKLSYKNVEIVGRGSLYSPEKSKGEKIFGFLLHCKG